MLVVEFFGIPRQRTGIAQIEIEAEGTPATLGELCSRLAARFPEFGTHCQTQGRLSRHVLANIDGRFFTTDLEQSLAGVRSVLFLSAEAGG